MCSISLVIREMKIITTMRYSFISSRMAIMKKQTMTSVDRDVEKLKPSFFAGGNV